jgi:hypothetical protein
MRGSYTQEIAEIAAITSKSLVNARPNEVVNMASTKMMKRKFCTVRNSPGTTTGFQRYG